MKHLMRRLFNRAWYSICSMHRKYDPSCPRCQAGRWVNPWTTERQARRFKETHTPDRTQPHGWLCHDTPCKTFPSHNG